ncbi:MAG: GNAT family N-acetyltransferase [Coriobacteriia bacterium]|nr:GNAT family N-acetyltransferase [Coriobacteriia bacterium]
MTDISTPLGQHRLSKSELEAAARTNAEAYMGYPLMDALFAHYDLRSLERLWRGSIASYGSRLIALADGPDVNAVSLWLPPNSGTSQVLPFLANGGFGLSPATWMKLMRYESYAEAMMKRNTQGDCWYLFDLAVRPSCQGKGHAGRQLRPMLEIIREQGSSCWLETHDPANVGLYEHFGFRLAETGTVSGSDVAHFGMLFNG